MNARSGINHDISVGPLRRCQISGSEELNLVIDLGHQAPCDALLTGEQLDEPEVTYPLRLMHCPESGLAQLDYVVDGSEIYPPSYPYCAGISWPVVEAHKKMAAGIVERFGPGLVVDIGCNDGTLLKAFRDLGCKVLGVEPTDQANAARDRGIEVDQCFFNENQARSISRWKGPAHIITMTNVFAHMAPLGEVMRGISALLADNGVLVIENHYLLDVLEKNQFDTVYHEHIRTYSLKALVNLFVQYGMEVFDVERAPRYGGNIRVYVGWKDHSAVSPEVRKLLQLEEGAGLHTIDAWEKFRSRVYENRDLFMEFMYRSARLGASMVGCAAAGRASTLLNFYGVRPDLMPYIGQPKESEKVGKYVPGCYIPIVDNERIVREQPDYVVILAWHYAAEIAARMRREGVKSTFVLPLPSFQVIEA